MDQTFNQGQESTLLGSGAHVAPVLGKAAAGIFGHSYALVAEAIEPGTDVLRPGIVWPGLRPARWPRKKCFVRKMGFEFFADLHVVVDGTISVREGHAIAPAAKAAIMAAEPAIYDVLVHIAPDSN